MKTILVFAAFVAVVSAQVPRYVTMPVFPNYTEAEWKDVMANQNIPSDDDLESAPRGTEQQPATSGIAISPPEGRIVNGNVAYPGQFPWQAAIFLDGRSFCGGSLISQKNILTAGHCVQGVKKFSVILGAHFVRKPEPSQQTRETTKAFLHEKYDRNTISNDIGLVVVDNDFTLNDRVNTIALPSKSMQSNLFESTVLTVSGFGRRDKAQTISPVLNFVRLPVMPNPKCAIYFGKGVRATNICGDGALGRSSCNGDSGGPLSYNEDGKTIVVGIVSYGSGAGCDVGYPSVYTRVTSYLGWIQTKAGIIIQR